MDNLLTFLDIRFWSIYTEVLANGRLPQGEVVNWNRRKGFEDYSIAMRRYPQVPELTQPIAKALGLV